MPHYDDPLWTVIVLTIIVLAGLWAHSRHDEPSGTSGTSDAGEPKIGSPPPAESECVPHKYKAKNHRDRGNQYDRALRNWTAVIACSGVSASLFAAFTLVAIRGQLTEMQKASVMSQRPWLYIEGDIKSIGLLIFSAVVQNSGNAIATNVQINGKVEAQSIRGIPGTIYTNSIPCGIYRDVTGRVHKVAIPPKQDQDTNFGIAYTGSIEALMKSRLTMPRLFVCIQYNWPFTGDIFHTYFSVATEVIDQKTGQAFPFMAVPDSLNGGIRTVGEISYIDAN